MQQGRPVRSARSVREASDPWMYSVSPTRTWIVGITRGAPSAAAHATWQISASSRIASTVARS